tara:strand:+ start:1616 stop:1993 length:378 start_codon:yes stop_codon:yes gene_type:complete
MLKKWEIIMRNMFFVVLLAACSASANNVEIYCNGLTNDNQRVELKLDVNTIVKKVTVDDADEFNFAVSNKFNYVWESRYGNVSYTNILNKLDGSMAVLMPNQDLNQPPVLRAQLICVAEKDIKFE